MFATIVHQYKITMRFEMGLEWLMNSVLNLKELLVKPHVLYAICRKILKTLSKAIYDFNLSRILLHFQLLTSWFWIFIFNVWHLITDKSALKSYDTTFSI